MIDKNIPKITIVTGAVFNSFEVDKYFSQSWSMKLGKKGFMVRVEDFDGQVDFDIFGDLQEIEKAEESYFLPGVSSKIAASVVVGSSGSKRCVGLVRFHLRRADELICSGGVALDIQRGRVQVLPMAAANYRVGNIAVAGKEGPAADWQNFLSTMLKADQERYNGANKELILAAFDKHVAKHLGACD